MATTCCSARITARYRSVWRNGRSTETGLQGEHCWTGSQCTSTIYSTPKARIFPTAGNCRAGRSEEHTSELSHTVISYAVFCLKKKKRKEVVDVTMMEFSADLLSLVPPQTARLFFFNDTATTEIYTLSLHDDLPI